MTTLVKHKPEQARAPKRTPGVTPTTSSLSTTDEAQGQPVLRPTRLQQNGVQPGSITPSGDVARPSLRAVLRQWRPYLLGLRGHYIRTCLLLFVWALALTALFVPLAWLFDLFQSGAAVDELANNNGLEQFISRWLRSVDASLLLTPINVVLLAGALAVLSAAVAALADQYAQKQLFHAAQMVSQRLQHMILVQLQSITESAFPTQKNYELATALSHNLATTLTVIEKLISHSFYQITRQGMLLAAALLLLGLLAWSQGAWFVIGAGGSAALLMLLLAHLFTRRIEALRQNQRTAIGDWHFALQQVVANVPGMTKARPLRRHPHQMNHDRQWTPLQDSHHQHTRLTFVLVQLRTIFDWVSASFEALVLTTICVLSWYGAGAGSLTFGTLLLSLCLTHIIMLAARKLMVEINQLRFTQTIQLANGLDQLQRVLRSDALVIDAKDAVHAPRFKGRIEFRHVSYVWHDSPLSQMLREPKTSSSVQPSLQGVYLMVEAGKLVALVGQPGSGHKCISQLLLRQYDPSAGIVKIDGADIRTLALPSLRQQISIIDHNEVFANGTVAENIANFQAEVRPEEVIRAAQRAGIHEAIVRLPAGYETALGDEALVLPFEMCQRIAIARAYCQNAPILLLIEPTQQLEEERAKALRETLRALTKGRTTLLITQDLRLTRFADKIIVFKSGRVEESGTHKELLADAGEYADLYADQFANSTADDEFAPPTPEVSAIFHSEESFTTAATSAQSSLASQDTGASKNTVAHSSGLIDSKPTMTPSALHSTQTSEPVTNLAQSLPVLPATQPTQEAKPDRLSAAQRIDFSDETSVRSGAATRLPTEATASNLMASLGLSRLHRLPFLAVAFQSDEMRDRLQTAFLGKPLEDLSSNRIETGQYVIEQCLPLAAEYLPGDSCRLHYDVTIRDVTTRKIDNRLVVARIFSDASQAAAYFDRQIAPKVAHCATHPMLAPFASAARLLSDPAMVVYVLPVDGESSMLLDATNSNVVREVLNRLLPDVVDGQLRLETCQPELLYSRNLQARNLQGLSLRYRADLVHMPDEQFEQRTIYGQLVNEEHGELIRTVLTTLPRHLQDRTATRQILLPRFLGYRSDLGVAFFDSLRGSPEIGELLRKQISEPGLAVGTGQTTHEHQRSLTLEQALVDSAQLLATLHLSHLQLGEKQLFADGLAAVRNPLQSIWLHAPALVMLVQDWVKQINRCADNWRPLPTLFAHGAFTHEQVFFEGNVVGLQDVTTLCQAEAALDLGNFVATLRLTLLHWSEQQDFDEQARTGANPQRSVHHTEIADRLCNLFVDTYFAAVNRRYERNHFLARVQIYEALTLVQVVVQSWRHFQHAQLERAIHLLDARLPRLPYPNPVLQSSRRFSMLGEGSSSMSNISPQ